LLSGLRNYKPDRNVWVTVLPNTYSMIRYTFTLIFALIYTFALFAQNGTPTVAGARGMAMGDASVTFHDINSAFSNQAGLAFIDEVSFTAFGEQRFMLAEIGSYAAALAYPTNSGTFGLVINYFGYENYNEQKIGLAYARKLFEGVAIGAQLDYLSTRIPEYGSAGKVTFELGVQADLLENFSVGAHIFSPIRTQLTDNEIDVVPTQLNVGIAYLPTKKVTLAIELEKDFDYAASFKGGLEYQLVDELSLRVGVGTNPTQNSFGIGIHLGSLDIDLAAAYHQNLGFTPGISVSYKVVRE